ncbi:MAG: DUF4278 domain-containing protein [Cyanobacteria bacterium RM1_2_2]|nr:DUF4278 domain-containing protein [Cyanobacteria bacterium RM1_2_2]
MKLTYRGVSYEYNPPKVEYGDRTQVGKYRGVDIRFRNLPKAPVLQPTLDLIYRGAAYTTHPTAVEPAAKAPSSIKEQARQLMMSHHRNVKRRQQTMLSRLDSQVGLPASDATHFWNHIRGEVHPSFGDSYDRSQATMS